MLLRGSTAPSPLRARAAESCRALGALLVAEARSDPIDRLAAEAAATAGRLRSEFCPHALPPGRRRGHRPGLAVLVDQLDWLAGVAAGVAAADRQGHPCRGEIDTVVEVAGSCWTGAATGLLTPDSEEPIRTGLRALMAARHRAANATLDRIGLVDGQFPVTSAQDPSFAARALGFGARPSPSTCCRCGARPGGRSRCAAGAPPPAS